MSDAGSQAFFVAFYRRLLQHEGRVHDAWRAAVQQVRKDGWGPGLWAGFVLYAGA